MATESLKLQLEIVDLVLAALAFAAAALFFAFKALSGYLISNLSLALTSHRQPTADAAKDYVTVVAHLKKGDRGAVTLHDAVATLYCGALEPALEPMVKRFPAVGRLGTVDVNGRLEVRQSTSTVIPLLSLPPGEETQFSTFFEVPHGQPCTIEVAILGTWPWRRKTRFQWRASLVSLPN